MNDPTVPSRPTPKNLFSALILPFFHQNGFRIFRMVLYCGIAYVALFVGPTPCQGQGCAYYLYRGHCSGNAWCNSQYTDSYSSFSDCHDHSGDNMGYCWGIGCSASGEACTCVPNTTDTVTVSDSISYEITGPGGWFGGSGSVTFNATDSLGHTVAINWAIGGSSGTCASAPCTQPLPEGAGSITYTGTCSGGQTASGSDTFRLDLTPPSVSGSLSGGTAGSGGYYTAGPVTLTCTGSDVPSGLFGITYGSQIASGDGSHTLSCTAQDNGGNTTPYSTVVRIDSAPPSVSLLCNGAPCGAGWYTVPVTVTAGASDATSGIAPGSALVSTDGGATWSASATLPDGTTSAMAQAFDVAGNSNSASGTVRVDRVAPSATFLCNGIACGSAWYSVAVVVSLNATDATSGLVPGSAQISTNGGVTWVPSATLTTEGSHNVQGRAFDVAGNSVNTSWVVQIDTVAPTVNGTLSGGVMGEGAFILAVR